MRQEQVQQAGQGMEQRQKTPLRKRRIMAIIIVALLVTVAIVVAQVLSNTMIIPAIWGNIASAIVGAFGAVFAFFALIPLLFPSDERQPKPALSAAKASTSQAATMPQLPANEVSTPTITQASTSDKEEGRSDQKQWSSIQLPSTVEVLKALRTHLKKQFARRDSKKALVKVIVQSFKVNEPLAELLITQLKDNGYLKDIGNDRYELTEEAIVTIASTRGGSHG